MERHKPPMPRKNPTFDRRTRNAIESHRVRAREVNQTLDYGLDELRCKVREAQQLPCCYCGVTLTDSNWSCDHATPTSRDGSYNLWNLEICCSNCNTTKGILTHEEFSQLLAIMSDWPSRARVDVRCRLLKGSRRYYK